MNVKVQQLHSQLATSDARGQALSNDNSRLSSEKQALVEKVDSLESTLTCFRGEIDDRSEKCVASSLK